MLFTEADAFENPAQNLSRRLEAAAAAQAAAAAANQCANVRINSEADQIQVKMFGRSDGLHHRCDRKPTRPS